MNKASNRILVTYKESHHKIPKCIGGTNLKSNLVDLTPEEHYVAHQLLVKMYPNNKLLVHAAVMMTVYSKNNIRNNKLYGWLRRKNSEEISKNQTGSGNSQFGKFWICELFSGKTSRSTSTIIPEGWIRGKTRYTKCKICNEFTGSKQRKFCDHHRPIKVFPNIQRSKGDETALKLASYCRSRTKENHPQYGKRWINNDLEQKMVPKDQLDSFIDLGWHIGKLPN